MEHQAAEMLKGMLLAMVTDRATTGIVGINTWSLPPSDSSFSLRAI